MATLLAISTYARDWLNLLIRSLHVIAAIGWIGSSFYFVLLDQSLRRPKDPADEEAGVKGELWEVHGGGFYHVQKYQVVPRQLPDHLAWFKWEAYTTWLSGFALLVVLFWLDAKSYLIDPSVADLSPWQAVGCSAGLLLAAWIFYDITVRLTRGREDLFTGVMVVGIGAAAWASSELFAARAAWLQVGAMLGTIMAANVLFSIIPAHWELIRAKQAGRDPDPAPGVDAKRRSVHNNYFTLPVLLTMLAGHFPFLTGRSESWVILLALMACGALIRVFYNRRHAGSTQWRIPLLVAAIVVALMIMLRPSHSHHATSMSAASSSAGRKVFVANCASCHTLADANASGSVGPNLDRLQPDAATVAAQVRSGGGGMPAFAGQLSGRQIDDVSAYVDNAAGDR